MDGAVEIVRSQTLSLHGLSGKPPNRAMANARHRHRLIDFVRGNRAATGKTPDQHGRFNGAV